MYQALDARVLADTEQRLKNESLRLFRMGHELGMQSFREIDSESQLETFAEALEIEREAIELGSECLYLRQQICQLLHLK